MKGILLTLMCFPLISFSTGNERLASKRAEALSFCRSNGLDTTLCILVDMSVHSGKDRLFVLNFSKDSLMSGGLCSHGCCDSEWGSDESKTAPTFSNVPESHCSSLGKYRIGPRGYSNWGIHVNYKLHGLEASNSNAFDRQIVMHSWDLVPSEECFPGGAPEGWGCPVVSNEQMRYIDKVLRSAEQPVLLWIYR